MLGIASAIEDMAAPIQTTKPTLSGKFYKILDLSLCYLLLLRIS